MDVFPFDGVSYFVERLGGVVEHPGDQVRREHLDPVVEVADGAVVVLPGVGDVVFDELELVLQVDEIGVGLEIRISFRDREQMGQRLIDLIFAFDLCAEISRRRRGGVVARGDDPLQGFLFVAGVAFDGFDEIGNQVVAFFQVDVHRGEGFVHLVAEADQAVAGGDQPNQDDDDNRDDNNRDEHNMTS